MGPARQSRVDREVGQPQAFAIPVGAYLLTIAYLEWRRGAARPVKRLLEGAGLIVLLGVSLLQAVGFAGAGYDRYVYDTLLLLESAGLLGLGAVLRWRRQRIPASMKASRSPSKTALGFPVSYSVRRSLTIW